MNIGNKAKAPLGVQKILVKHYQTEQAWENGADSFRASRTTW